MCKYEVKCKCGHVGKKNYIIIAFPIIAESGKDAATRARQLPRVKHDQKDAIISVRKITDEEFEELISINNNDLYLKCNNKQEQKMMDLSNRILKEGFFDEKDVIEEERSKQCFFGKIKIRKPKRFIKNILNVDYKEAYIW